MLTDEERRELASLLEESHRGLVAAVAGLSDAQWCHRRSDGRWSVADVVEHLAMVEAGVPRFVQTQLLSSAPVEPNRTRDARIRSLSVNRSRAVEAPERVRPCGQWPTGPEALEAFSGLRRKLIDYVHSTPDDLRHHAGPHPMLGSLDGYQWLLFLAAHTERHAAQIEECRRTAYEGCREGP